MRLPRKLKKQTPKPARPFVLMTYGFKKLGNRVNQSSQAFKALAQVFQEVGENK